VPTRRRKARRVLTGGAPIKGKGNWFAPTVLADVDHSMSVMRDEAFGPIIGMQAVDDDEPRSTLMNDTDYGLTAGVYSARREAREEAF
jgi:acyl-CoA reductase-like NAD-dependent aldehyde dehydrogenase